VPQPRCVAGAGAPLQAWLEAVAPRVKALAPRQLLTVGLEGFWGASHATPPAAQREQARLAVGAQHGTDFIANCAVRGIDFARCAVMSIR
jgi:mannan endo-1,4-beta-mannosidase